MSYSSLDIQLDLLDSQLQELSAIVVKGDALALPVVGARLQQLAVELIQLADAAGRQTLGLQGRLGKLRSLSARLSIVRESLMRQTAFVDHALALVVPATQQKATYAGSSKGYGSPIRQSGAFTVLAA